MRNRLTARWRVLRVRQDYMELLHLAVELRSPLDSGPAEKLRHASYDQAARCARCAEGWATVVCADCDESGLFCRCLSNPGWSNDFQ